MNSFFDFKINSIDGQTDYLKQFKGNIILAINIAAECEYSYQLEDLENLYKKYYKNNFIIIGIPTNIYNCNPGNEQDTLLFLKQEYNITFPLTSKIDKEDLLWNWLINEPKGYQTKKFDFNFMKWIIDKKGRCLQRHDTWTPIDQVESIIKRLIY